jgi:hypothetical protein
MAVQSIPLWAGAHGSTISPTLGWLHLAVQSVQHMGWCTWRYNRSHFALAHPAVQSIQHWASTPGGTNTSRPVWSISRHHQSKSGLQRMAVPSLRHLARCGGTISQKRGQRTQRYNLSNTRWSIWRHRPSRSGNIPTRGWNTWRYRQFNA